MRSEDVHQLRIRLIQQVINLPIPQLADLHDFLTRLTTNLPATQVPLPVAVTPVERDWPHAPLHRLGEKGTYFVTSSTLHKAHHFQGPERLDYLETKLLSFAKNFGWQLEAWAVFSNHYHFVAQSPQDPSSLVALTKELHYQTAQHVNQLDQIPGRQVWFNYRETQLTYEKSYLARLSYVHRNAVKHGLVSQAAQYPWCSAAWLERTATTAQVETLYRMKIDRLSIEDDFDPV